MTYDKDIPNATDLISNSQGQIKQNFQALGTAWPVNHVDFNDVGAGKHNYVEFPNQGADPAGAASEFTLFSKVSGAGASEIFYKRDNEATVYQLTGANPSVGVSGYTFLPGALLMQWSFLTGANKNDGAAIVFPKAFSIAPYSLQLTASRNGTSTNVLNATSVTNLGFTLRTSTNSNDGVWYLAIGAA